MAFVTDIRFERDLYRPDVCTMELKAESLEEMQYWAQLGIGKVDVIPRGQTQKEPQTGVAPRSQRKQKGIT